MSEERPEERRRLVRRIVGLFSAYRGRTALILVSIVVTSALGIVNPLLIQVVFDDALFVEGGPKLGLLYALVGDHGGHPAGARGARRRPRPTSPTGSGTG